MDIDLFSEMVKGLILDNDEVTLPGLGTFVSEVVPSSFSDKGYTINPPYRKLSFRQRESGDERLMAEFYARANGTDYETSVRILSDFIAGLKSALQTRKMVVFPGLGRLRATKENTFFFIADEDLDIYPYGVGLEPVSLKTHEETPDEVADGVAVLREMLDGGASTGSATAPSGSDDNVESVDVVAEHVVPSAKQGAQVAEPVVRQNSATVEEQAVGGGASTGSATVEMSERPVPQANVVQEQPAEPQPAEPQPAEPQPAEPQPAEPQPAEQHLFRPRRKKGWRKALIAVACVAGILVLALGIFILLASVAPDFIDSILYTPEELRIINY